MPGLCNDILLAEAILCLMLVWTEDDELKGVWKEVTVIYFKILSHDIPKEKPQKAQSW
jgi:hypothetical protein